MTEGVVIKAYSGYYYVYDGAILWECSLRGKFRLAKQTVLVGDRVRVTPVKEHTGRVDQVLPRTTELIRPPVANVEQAVIVFALSNPEPNLALLDRFLILAEAAAIEPLICLNKIDQNPGRREPEWCRSYRRIGYRVLLTSTKTDAGIAALQEILIGRISVFAGPSGVGKSSLLNAVQPGLALKTGDISAKLKRGKHTTRHVELLTLTGGGLVADTPGFSSLNLPEMKREELQKYFPEMDQFYHECRFQGCLHHREPDCAVKKAASAGLISAERYEDYIRILEEVIANERRY